MTSIGTCAFLNCTSLSYIVLPKNLKYIGTEAFEYCTKLKSINIPGTVPDLQYRVFYRCTNLSTVVLNEGLTHISDSAFTSEKIKKLIIPKSVEYISCDAFAAVRYDDTNTPNCTNINFFCRRAFEPEGYEEEWNLSRPVTWGYTGS